MAELSALVSQGESENSEFKRSTGELKEAMQTLCGFLNGMGGTALFGVKPDGTIEGQEVSDQTLRDIAQVCHGHASLDISSFQAHLVLDNSLDNSGPLNSV